MLHVGERVLGFRNPPPKKKQKIDQHVYRTSENFPFTRKILSIFRLRRFIPGKFGKFFASEKLGEGVTRGGHGYDILEPVNGVRRGDNVYVHKI